MGCYNIHGHARHTVGAREMAGQITAIQSPIQLEAGFTDRESRPVELFRLSSCP